MKIGIGLSIKRGSAGSPWYEAAQYDDWAVIADLENNRYAMPTSLTRVNGKYLKRGSSFSEIFDVDRPALPTPTPPFAITPWYTYAAGAWSLLGGDGIGVDVPRMESWLGTRGMWVEPNQRFNRIPDSQVMPGLPRTTNPTRSWVYTVSWVGNANLLCTCGAASTTLNARSADPNGLNWGILPVVGGWAGEGTTFAISGGGVAHSVMIDTQSNSTPRPPSSMIATQAGTFIDGPFIAAHVDRAAEHVRMSDAVMDLLKLPGGSNSRLRTGTLIVDQQQLAEPLPGARHVILGGGTDWASVTPSYFAFHESAGVYTAQFQTGDHNGDLSFTTTAAGTRSRMKMGLAIQYSAATPWTNQKRAGITGQVASTAVSNPIGVEGNPAFWFNSGRMESNTDTPGPDNAGMGVFYGWKWSPDFLSEAQLLAALA